MCSGLVLDLLWTCSGLVLDCSGLVLDFLAFVLDLFWTPNRSSMHKCNVLLIFNTFCFAFVPSRRLAHTTALFWTCSGLGQIPSQQQ